MALLPNIIAISGKQYSGKDTVASIMLKYLPDYSRIGIGDAIKIELAKRKNIDVSEIYQNKHLYRQELIELGNWGREQSGEYWLNNLTGFNKIIVPDLRVLFELQYLKKKGAVLIRVEASYEARCSRGVVVNNNDPTETELDNYSNWDYVLKNESDYETLEKNVKSMVDTILRKSC